MKSYVPLAIAAVVLVGGCGKKDPPAPVTSEPSIVKPEGSTTSSTTSSVPTPPPPPPDAPKGTGAQAPQPGQNTDHSSPAFKGGGVPDKK